MTARSPFLMRELSRRWIKRLAMVVTADVVGQITCFCRWDFLHIKILLYFIFSSIISERYTGGVEIWHVCHDLQLQRWFGSRIRRVSFFAINQSPTTFKSYFQDSNLFRCSFFLRFERPEISWQTNHGLSIWQKDYCQHFEWLRQ